MELYLIRHGQSTNQTADSPDGRVFDPGLTELGERQAVLLAQFLSSGKERATAAEHTVTSLFCSPMWRALQTTRPLSEALEQEPAVWVDVHEQVLAAETFAGSSRERIRAAFPDYKLPDDITQDGWWNRARESRSACMARAIRVADELWARQGSGETVAIVSHARFLDALLKAFLRQLPGYEYWHHHYNTAVSRLGLDGERLDIRYLNRVDHLPQDLVSS